MNKGASVKNQMQWIGMIPAITALVILVGSTTLLRLYDARQELENQGEFTLQYLARASEYGLISGNIEDLRQQAQLLMMKEEVEYVAFASADGKQFGEFYRDSAKRKRPDWQYFSTLVYPQLLNVGENQYPDMEQLPLGSVTIALGTEAMQQRQAGVIASSLIAAIAGIVISLLLANWLARINAKPIIRLARLVHDLRDGDFSLRGNQQLDGELHTLQDNINGLAAFLEESEMEKVRSMEQLMIERQKAENSNEAKSQFLAVVSHELRTPLTGILGAMDLLSNTNQDPDQVEYTRVAMAAAKTLAEMVDDILDFSSIENDSLELNHSWISITQLFQACKESFRLAASKKGLDFHIDISEELEDLQIYSDATRISQVLNNLVSNAIKFTDHGSVTLAAHCKLQGNHGIVTVSVRDTGVGIREEDIEGLFKVFSQIDSSTTRRHGGTGLGLAIVERLTKLLGGTIQVESQPGAGSSFIFQFEADTRKAGRQG